MRPVLLLATSFYSGGFGVTKVVGDTHFVDLEIKFAPWPQVARDFSYILHATQQNMFP